MSRRRWSRDVPLGFAIALSVAPVVIVLAIIFLPRLLLRRQWMRMVRSLPEFTGERPVRK